MENKIYGRIYIITNLINGKIYIGQTTQTIQKRLKGHIKDSKIDSSMAICRAIKKYGKENFKIEQIDVAYNQMELNLIEGVYMAWFNSFTPAGYNIKRVIDGKGKHSPETIEKIKIANNKPERLKQNSKLGIKSRGKLRKDSKIEYVGVTFRKNKYVSRIRFKNKTIHIGYYNNKIDAAKAYDITAIKHFGSDCNLNFPELREQYLNCEIIINKCSHKDKSKSGIKGVWFCKRSNKWCLQWFDKKLNKNRCKYFTVLEEAVEFKKLYTL